jgi:hypothetical protein
VAWPAFETVAVERRETTAASQPVTPERRDVADLLTFTHGLGEVAPAAGELVPPHLCVSPKGVLFHRDGPTTTQQVTISNPGTSAVLITSVIQRSDRAVSGVVVDASGCERTILSPGEHCTMKVSLRRRIGETVELWIFNDAGEPVPLAVMAPECV